MELLTIDPEPFADAEPLGRITPHAHATHAIVHELAIDAPAPAVYEAVTAPDGLSGGWTRPPPEQAGDDTVTVLFGQDEVTLQAQMAEAPEIIQWDCVQGPDEWVGTSVALRIEELPEEENARSVSLVRFWHGGWPYEDGLMPRASFQWAMLLDALRRYVEAGGAGSPA
jgi:uncharacterized protein YndB with AHSA1/START domain